MTSGKYWRQKPPAAGGPERPPSPLELSAYIAVAARDHTAWLLPIGQGLRAQYHPGDDLPQPLASLVARLEERE